MAGNYMDAPASRRAWDRDGSVLVGYSVDLTLSTRPSSEARLLNNEDADRILWGDLRRGFGVLFPMPLDLVAVFIGLNRGSGNTTGDFGIETSQDTTNGIDGLWVPQSPVQQVDEWVQPAKPNYREADKLHTLPNVPAAQGVRGIRFIALTGNTGGQNASSWGFQSFHIYGDPAASATPQRIELWHPTLDVRLPITWLDWGNVPRGSSADRLFRIKNLSPSHTAHSIDVHIEALTPGEPSVVGMHLLSSDGVNFGPLEVISALEPGEISPVLTIRRTVPANANVSVWSARVAADVYEWSL